MSGRRGSGSFGSRRTAGYAIGEDRTSPWLEAIAGIRGDHVPGWAPSPCRLPRGGQRSTRKFFVSHGASALLPSCGRPGRCRSRRTLEKRASADSERQARRSVGARARSVGRSRSVGRRGSVAGSEQAQSLRPSARMAGLGATAGVWRQPTSEDASRSSREPFSMVDGQPGSGVRACLPVSVCLLCVCAVGGWVWWVGLGTLGVTLNLDGQQGAL